MAQVDDSFGPQGAEQLTITIGGTNDYSTIDASTDPVPLDEVLGDSSAQDIPPTTGTITFTDQDLGDDISFSVTGNATATYNGGAVPIDPAVDISQLIDAAAISFADGGLLSNGDQQTIDWTFHPQTSDLDWLKDGDTLELTWIAQVDDSFGPQGAEQLTITIGGTNDLPTIDASTDPVPLDEVLGDSSAQDIPPTTGTITFTDQDLGDDISFSVTGNATATYNGGAVPIDPAVDISQLIDAAAISFADGGLLSNGDQQTIDWTFHPQTSDLDWLKDGDTLELTWIAQVDDSFGPQGAEQLTITIGGTNDLPTIDASTDRFRSMKSWVIAPHKTSLPPQEPSPSPIKTSVIDISFSVTGNATATYNGGAVPIDPAVDISQPTDAAAISFADGGLLSNGDQQTIDWTFHPQTSDLDWLKDGDTLELTWIAQVDDSFGPQGAEQLTITIGGTNDLPTIDHHTDPVPLDEVLGDSSAQDIPPTTGTITFTDQDLGDDISFSVTGN